MKDAGEEGSMLRGKNRHAGGGGDALREGREREIVGRGTIGERTRTQSERGNEVK